MSFIDLRTAFTKMARIRATEQHLLDLFGEGLISGTVHTCIGQEAVAVGVVSQLDPSIDIICSNHRGHGHFLAYCEDYRGLISEVMGLPGGVCRGIGGSQHLHKRNFYSNGILGGMSAVGLGMAKAEKLSGSGAMVTVFHGDGAMSEGIIYESLNMAGLWRLPYLLCIEHNHYAQSTHWEQQHAGNLALRAEHFGLVVTRVNGNDVNAVAHAARQAISRARAFEPQVLVLETYRLAPHSKGDDLRAREEIHHHKQRCPLTMLRPTLGDNWCDDQWQQAQVFVSEIVADIRGESGL